MWDQLGDCLDLGTGVVRPRETRRLSHPKARLLLLPRTPAPLRTSARFKRSYLPRACQASNGSSQRRPGLPCRTWSIPSEVLLFFFIFIFPSYTWGNGWILARASSWRYCGKDSIVCSRDHFSLLRMGTGWQGIREHWSSAWPDAPKAT